MSPAKVLPDKQRGHIVPIGGAEDKEGDSDILRKFLEISGGKKARVVIIPTASSLDDTGRRYEKIFKKLGAQEARAVPVTTRAEASKEEGREEAGGGSEAGKEEARHEAEEEAVARQEDVAVGHTSPASPTRAGSARSV